MPGPPVIDVINDASVVIKWFHAEGEEEVAPARALLTRQSERTVALFVLDLTRYEIGNALLRGHMGLPAANVDTVLGALSELCPAITPTNEDLRTATALAQERGLTLYDAAYAAVARQRGARLATLDRQLLRSGLGRRPSDLQAELFDR